MAVATSSTDNGIQAAQPIPTATIIAEGSPGAAAPENYQEATGSEESSQQATCNSQTDSGQDQPEYFNLTPMRPVNYHHDQGSIDASHNYMQQPTVSTNVDSAATQPTSQHISTTTRQQQQIVGNGVGPMPPAQKAPPTWHDVGLIKGTTCFVQQYFAHPSNDNGVEVINNTVKPR